MKADSTEAFVILTRAEAEALLDPSKATPEMLRDKGREGLGLPPPSSVFEKLEDWARDVHNETRRVVCICVDDGDDYEELGTYARGAFFWLAERFEALNADDDGRDENTSGCCGAPLRPEYIGATLTKYRCEQCGRVRG